MKIDIGTAQMGRAELDFSNSAGAKILGNPGMGKSTVLETIARTAKRSVPNLRVLIISTTGRFDYDLNFEFEFYSPIRHRDAMFNSLEDLQKEMTSLLNQMEAQNTKDVTRIAIHRPTLLLVDELESCEEVLEKKDRDLFARLLTLRINGGRKLQQWTITATQGQTLDTTFTKTRSLEYIILGRPQTKALCQALSIDEKYCLDHELNKGRLLLIANGDCQVVKVRKET